MRLHCRIPLASFELDVAADFEARVAAIFGPSGSGKTTLLDAIAGLRSIVAGEIEISGHVLFSSARGICKPARERGIGYVPQECALFPHLSVEQNITFGASRSGDFNVDRRVVADHVIDVLEIRNLLNRKVTNLSGGESQRVALARAILSAPQLLLLDEPLAALDIGLKEKILPYLNRVRDEFSIPIIYVSHNIAEVIALADWVLMIRHGKLLVQGIPGDVLRSRDAMETIAEDSIENVFNVSIVESDKKGGRTRVRTKQNLELFVPFVGLPAGRELQIRLSGDDIVLATERPAGISAANVIAGRISQTEEDDNQSVLKVDATETFYVRLTPSAVARLGVTPGSPVFLIIKTRSFRLL